MPLPRWLSDFFKKPPLPVIPYRPPTSNEMARLDHFVAPSPEFPDRIAAIERLLQTVQSHEFSSFQAIMPDGTIVSLDVLGSNVEFSDDVVDLRAIAATIGLADVSVTTRLGRGRSWKRASEHECKGASSSQLAQLVDAVFIHHYKLPDDYTLEGTHVD